ncbi:acyl carrier protein [Pontibacter anaerobius]|uniref:Acyl carrier protein n=1 Tax=Pontibacter anaerobius TaxID=2993940 RepID=A0ABT3RI29_9BACT|nr:acyl carrier protein [Pontibacter anaerobius]MCX2741195.1 acyl carrier protein [Pontibacter anaerobius]
MKNVTLNTQAIQNEVVHIITSITNINPNRLLKVRDLTRLGLDIIDVVDIILKVEKTYQLTIPDEVPVYTVDDFVNYVCTHRAMQAS